jgi:LysR family hydrogen peroxide-inducible transcriptional activator
MNLRDLTYLVALADHRHFGRAAEACHVSQPTLSGQIRKLEEHLGVTLLERDSRNVALTEAGLAVLVEARASLAHARAIEDIARSHRDPLAGRFRLGVIASLGPFLTPDLLTGLAETAPRLELVLTENLTDALIVGLRGRGLDAAIIATALDGDDLIEIPLFDEPFLIGCAPDHPFAAAASVSTASIEGERLLLLAEGHCLRDQALSLCGSPSVDDRLGAASLVTLMRLAARGRGITIVPSLGAGLVDGLCLRPITDESAFRRVRLVTRRHYPRTGALQAIAKAAQAASLQASAGCREVRVEDSTAP